LSAWDVERMWMLRLCWEPVTKRPRRIGRRVGFLRPPIFPADADGRLVTVLKELEEDDVLWQARKLQKEAAEKHAEEQRLALEEAAAEEAEERTRKRRAAAAEARFL
jgi:hypothetical protein